MARPQWFVSLIKKGFPHRFQLAKLTRAPVLGRAAEFLLFEGDDLVVLPKDSVIQVQAAVEREAETVLPSQVVEHFIEQADYHWIMNACICRDASSCRDYPVGLGCLFLGRAAMQISPELGRPVSKAEALAHVQKCREAGLVHLVGRNKLDAVWLGVGPGHQLLTICNCCPCCCLWRALPQFADTIGAKVNRMPGVRLSVSHDCGGCGRCREVCFADAIRLVDTRARIGEACRGCGRCVEACPKNAITLSVDRAAYVDSAVARLTPLVDLK